jgi:hypothetical protein
MPQAGDLLKSGSSSHHDAPHLQKTHRTVDRTAKGQAEDTIRLLGQMWQVSVHAGYDRPVEQRSPTIRLPTFMA